MFFNFVEMSCCVSTNSLLQACWRDYHNKLCMCAPVDTFFGFLPARQGPSTGQTRPSVTVKEFISLIYKHIQYVMKNQTRRKSVQSAHAVWCGRGVRVRWCVNSRLWRWQIGRLSGCSTDFLFFFRSPFLYGAMCRGVLKFCFFNFFSRMYRNLIFSPGLCERGESQ